MGHASMCPRVALYREVDSRLVYACATKRLNDLSLLKKGRKDTKIVFIFREGEVFEGVMNDKGLAERMERGAGPVPYRFVNMMSDAPSIQRIICGCRYICAERIAHLRGSSSLEASYRQ